MYLSKLLLVFVTTSSQIEKKSKTANKRGSVFLVQYNGTWANGKWDGAGVGDSCVKSRDVKNSTQVCNIRVLFEYSPVTQMILKYLVPKRVPGMYPKTNRFHNSGEEVNIK